MEESQNSKTKNLFAVIYDEKRPLEKEEYANLSKKTNGGFFNAHFLRQNIFNAVSRISHKPYSTPKVVYENEDQSIAISHPLSQKHADILTLIYTDNVAVSKPAPDGSYKIKIIPYQIAKKMGYKYPEKAYENVLKMIRQMRWTDFVVRNRKDADDPEKDDVKEFPILGEVEYNIFEQYYEITVPGNSAKLLSHSVAFTLSPELNEKIISIDDKYPQLKAVVRYILSNAATKNGYSFDFLCNKFDVKKNRKGEFLSMFQLTQKEKSKDYESEEIKDRLKKIESIKKLLSDFSITFDEKSQKFYYNDHTDTKFLMAVDPEKILKKLTIQNYIGAKIIYENLSLEAHIVDINMSMDAKGRYDLRVKDGNRIISMNKVPKRVLERIVYEDVKED